MQRRHFTASTATFIMLPAWAHHGWSSFDQARPIYLEGKARKVSWRNPHVEFDLELPAELKLPADLARRPVPAQSAPVDGPKLLAAAQLPKRKDKVWEIELAPLTRIDAWQMVEIKPGTEVSVLGFTFGDEKGEAVLRAEYIWVGGKAYGMRSSPA
jgi:Family of unknown function (DUF6152)